MVSRKNASRAPVLAWPKSTALATLTLILAAGLSASAQTITTFAGNGLATFGGDNGTATAASLNGPRGIAFDTQGNTYIADTFNNRVRKVNASGTISTFAGNGTAGFGGDGGQATAASLNEPNDVVVDAQGNVLIADSANQRIRRVAPDGTITTIAGNGHDGYNGDNIPALNATLNHPNAIRLNGAGDMYIADPSNQRIRKVSNGTITTFAGNGIAAYSGENVSATSASLNFPGGLAIDSAGNVFIADAGNHVIRKVNTSGIITTVAGNGAGAGTGRGTFSGDGGLATSAGLNTPEAVAVDSANTLFIADTENLRIRKVANGIITTIAGTGTDGFSGDNGPATSALLNLPWSLALASSGNLYFGDYMNNRVRVIASAGAPTQGGGGGTPTLLSGGIVNAASFKAGGAVDAGSIVALFGSSLATGVGSAATLPLPPNINGTSVTFNGTPAPLFFVSPGQINAQVPTGVPMGTVKVQVTVNGTVGPTQTVTIGAFSPGVFTVPPGGTGAGAILLGDSSVLVSSGSPAHAGDFLTIYCTGLGPVNPAVAAGASAPSNPPAQTMTGATVSVGGINAVVGFAGLTPGLAGLYQVNAQVPPGVAAGSAVPVVVSIGGSPANTVTINVQ